MANINGISNPLMMELIDRTNSLLRIGRDRSYFLLLQYEWNEDRLRSEISHLGAAVFINNSVAEPLTESLDETCVRCMSYARCETLNCHHVVCHKCLEGCVLGQVNARILILSCPNEECNRYLSPSSLVSLLPAELVKEYTQLVMRDFIARTSVHRPHPIKKGLLFLWNNKREIFDCGVIGVIGVIGSGAVVVLKFDKWRKKNPRTFSDIMFICNLIKDGQSPASFSFWYNLFFGRRNLEEDKI